MLSTEPKPLGDCFDEGQDARRNGRSVNDDPYGAGSCDRREKVGFCAPVEVEDDVDRKLGPNDEAEVRTSD